MISVLLFALLPNGFADDEAGWSKAVVVTSGFEPVVRFQARWEQDYIIVRAMHEPGWHTYAMDNELRSREALKGKKSLGIEQGVAIKVESGLELDNRWRQTAPSDYSKPKLRWFTYGFDRVALFACRVKKVNAGPVMLRIRGQACSGETCCQVDVTLTLPAASQPAESTQSREKQVKAMLKGLVSVKKRAKQPEDAVR
jgi:hypothetical protein